MARVINTFIPGVEEEEDPTPKNPDTTGSSNTGSTGGKVNTTTDTVTGTTTDTIPEKAPEIEKFTYEPYTPSDAVVQAESILQQQIDGRPGAYTSQWQAQLDDIINRIMNREDFSYDLNGDALYQQYKDQYMRQGQLAMMDTMGQAAALTGGYGNSYAQSVGQQAYQGYLQGLNDRVPELYQLALDRYNREGDELYTQYGMYADREEQDYGRYRDSLSDYYTELSRLTEDARYKGEQDYGRWADERDFTYGQFTDDRDYNYQLEQDKLARDEAAAQLMASVGDYSLLGQLYDLTDEQIAALTPKKSSGSIGGDAGDKGGGKILTATPNTDAFEKTLTLEKNYDAVMRAKWGSYRGYVGAMIDRAETAGILTKEESDYLSEKYKITSADRKI